MCAHLQIHLLHTSEAGTCAAGVRWGDGQHAGVAVQDATGSHQQGLTPLPLPRHRQQRNLLSAWGSQIRHACRYRRVLVKHICTVIPPATHNAGCSLHSAADNAMLMWWGHALLILPYIQAV